MRELTLSETQCIAGGEFAIPDWATYLISSGGGYVLGGIIGAAGGYLLAPRVIAIGLPSAITLTTADGTKLPTIATSISSKHILASHMLGVAFGALIGVGAAALLTHYYPSLFGEA